MSGISGVSTFNGLSGAVTGVSTVDSVSGAVQLSTLAAFAKSLGGNGYQKLPSGLIIQWGDIGPILIGVAKLTTFPITFPNSWLSIVATPNPGGIGTQYALDVTPNSNSNFYAGGTGSGYPNSNYYIAIGF